MPCATIHMLTAGRVLRRWSNDPHEAPFPPENPVLRRAFLLGAMGPDMGFVPGIDRFVSELSHYVRTGELVRALLDESEEIWHEAFAWGWATHHLTDVEIHPLVGRACGELLHGDRSLRLNASADCQTHVAMEVGLDLTFLGSDPSIPRPPGPALPPGSNMDFVGRSLERTYAVAWDRETVERDYLRAAARTARWPRILTLLARARRFEGRWRRKGPDLVGGALRPVLDLASWIVPRGGPPAGFLRPLEPPDWLRDQVSSVADEFPDRFQDVVESRMASVENRNLETGLHEDAPQEHPDSERTRDRLRSLQKTNGRGRPVAPHSKDGAPGL